MAAAYIGVDSLGYLSTTGLGRAIATANEERTLEDAAADTLLHAEFCYGCMEKQGWPFDPEGAQPHIDPIGTRPSQSSNTRQPEAGSQVGAR